MIALELSERANAWLVIALGIWLQALPFLLLGTVLSSALTAFVPRQGLRRLLPRNPLVAVPLAGAAGVLLPACECSSVPTARSLARAGVPQAAAVTFMTAAPGINPVVVAATAMAYAMHPVMAAARFGAGLLASVLIGLAWNRFGVPLRQRDEDAHVAEAEPSHGRAGVGRWQVFRTEFVQDSVQSLGFLVFGAAVAASMKTLLPTGVLRGLTSHLWVQVLALAALAVVVALCSEADAFMAVSLTAFSPIAQLTFLVVGPIVDVKLLAMQTGAFGRRFLVRFVPIALASALVSAVLVGSLVLGR